MRITDDARIKCGTTNNSNPQVVYVSYLSWLNPLSGECDTAVTYSVIKSFKKNIRDTILETDFLDDRSMCDFDIKWNVLENQRPARMPFEIFVKQREGNSKSLREMRNLLEELFREPILTFLDDLKEIGMGASMKKLKTH